MSSVIRSALHSRFKISLFLLGVGLPSLLLAAECVRIAWAARLGKSSKTADIRRSVSLDPANPDLHFRLGMAEVYDLADSGAEEGTRQLRLATELSPHETRYWTALASACEFEGKSNCAGHAIARVLALSPMAPRIHWEAANYDLWANRQEQALGQFRCLLELDPHYARAIFAASLGAVGDPEVVYITVLTSASGSKLKLAYVSFLSSHGYWDFAFQVWKDLAASKSAFDFSAADPYLEYLIAARKYAEATTVWHDLEVRGLVQQPSSDGNLVFNGGFEHIPLNTGFDWRYHQEPYVAINFKGQQPYQGSDCLKLDFSDVENHQEEPVYQLVPVRADQTYVLTAEVRSNNITSDSGPRLRVIDPSCQECLSVSTDAVLGTTPWHEVSLRFQTTSQTTAVRVSVWRARSLGYPTEILGTLWLDQVSLRAVAPVPAQIAQRRGTS
jgi:hypothetical protein